jgi:uncharacterized damage-inducible protein DinB
MASDDDLLGLRADERTTLCGMLDWYRAVVERKALGLSEADAAKVLTPSGLSVLGVVAHLAWAEEGWFAETFAGEVPADTASNPESFRLRPGDSIESVVSRYRAEVERSRRIVAGAASLDELSAGDHHEEFGKVSLRWILCHMIEETARHAGHLDIMREQLDGRTGD